MIDLEQSLAELADRLEIPGGDWLVADVLRRIDEPAPTATRRHPALRLAVVLVAVLAVVTVVLPGPRHAVARWLGFDSVRIEPGVTVPTTATPSTTSTTTVPTAASTATTASTTLPEPDLGLGPAISIGAAISRTGLADPTPALLGAPRSVHVVQPPEAGQIVLVYAPSDLVPQSSVTGVGALVSVLPATIDEGLFVKTLGDTATVRPSQVGTSKAYWIEGAPHQVFFQTGDQIVPQTLRLATNTLLWERDGRVYRIEADIDLDTALRIANSIR